MNNQHSEAIGGEAKAKPEVIKLGSDLHARQVTECRQLDGSIPKPAQKWDPGRFLDEIESWVRAGIKVYSCYDAGACGYWYHREVVKRGAINFVIAPQPLETRRSGQKTDGLDARALLRLLVNYLGGDDEAMSVVAVPRPEQEQQRSVVRYREQLLRDRRRAEASRPVRNAECRSCGRGIGASRGLAAKDFAPASCFPRSLRRVNISQV